MLNQVLLHTRMCVKSQSSRVFTKAKALFIVLLRIYDRTAARHHGPTVSELGPHCLLAASRAPVLVHLHTHKHTHTHSHTHIHSYIYACIFYIYIHTYIHTLCILSIYPSIHLSFHPFIYLSICLSIYLSIRKRVRVRARTHTHIHKCGHTLINVDTHS